MKLFEFRRTELISSVFHHISQYFLLRAGLSYRVGVRTNENLNEEIILSDVTSYVL